MHDVVRVSRIIFRDHDLPRRQEPARHIDGRFEVPARITPQVENEHRITRFHEFTERAPEKLRRIRRESHEVNNENAVVAPGRRERGDVDDVARRFDLARLAPPFAEHEERDLCPLLPPNLRHRGRDIHAVRVFAVDLQYFVPAPYSRTFGGRALQGRDDRQYLIADGDLHPDTPEGAAHVIGELLIFLRRQEEGVRIVQGSREPLYEAPYALLVGIFGRGRERSRCDSGGDEFLINDAPRFPQWREIDICRRSGPVSDAVPSLVARRFDGESESERRCGDNNGSGDNGPRRESCARREWQSLRLFILVHTILKYIVAKRAKRESRSRFQSFTAEGYGCSCPEAMRSLRCSMCRVRSVVYFDLSVPNLTTISDAYFPPRKCGRTT